MAIKTVFTAVALACSFGAFAPYLINIRKGTARPHVLTWATWTILTTVAFFVSFLKGGGGGAWPFALQAGFCFFVASYAIFHGEKNITGLDRLSFFSALTILAVYIFTKQAALSAVLAASVDALGYFPTFRKSYSNPSAEPVLTYVFACLSDLFSITALGAYSVATVFYPATLALMNVALVSFLLVRAGKLKT